MADVSISEPVKAESPPLADIMSDFPSSPNLVKNEPRVLTPPTSEDMNKHEDNSSDLSDLESEDEDDIGEIEPDHYYGDGKIPVFKPTMDQFRSFSKYIEKIDKYGMKSGIVKVVPPQEWRDALPDLSEAVKTIKVKNPIMQEFAGTHGTYTAANIEKQRSYNLPQWKALTEESSHQPPAKRGESRKNTDLPAKARAAARAAAQTDAGDQEPKIRRRPGRPPVKKPAEISTKLDPVSDADEDDTLQVPPTPISPDQQAVLAPTKGKRGAATRKKPGPKPKDGGPGKAKSVSSRRMNNQSEAAGDIDEKAFKNFNYKLEDVDEYTPERCAELEQVYWKTLNYGTPMYGADMPGSLFEDKMETWNVAHLENLLDILGTKVPGVNTTYLYLGMWKATFAWHLEDVDLYSINYIHFGAPKHWYSISQEDARRFENAMKTLWPADAKHCDQFLRHKTYLISPEKLKSQFNIKVNKLVHNEGEFVITYPYGYHSGFNMGYNCAESVNFATDQWLNYGRIAKKCYCEEFSVWVDVNEIERKLRGEPTPEFYETEEEVSEDEAEVALPVVKARGRPKAMPGRKRKRDDKEPDAAETKRKTKKIKIRVKVPTIEPCILCPNDVAFDELLPTDNGKKAHRLCAMYTPETYIKHDKRGVEKVFGTNNVNKQRLAIKCSFCKQKRVSFQCHSKKCARGYHATCAAAAGALVDYGPVPYFKDGVEYISEGYDFRCRWHRPKRVKGTDVDALEKISLNRVFGKSLQKGDVVQAQFLNGDAFGAVVVRNRPAEAAVLVDIIPEGDRIELEYKYLLPLDSEESLRPKPSADALPLPEEFILDGEEQITEQDGIPKPDDLFCNDENYKWAEWHSCAYADVRNPAQAKINLEKPDQMWHFVGKNSTEARPIFTHDLRVKVNNPKSNFLDLVKPPPVAMPPQIRRPTYQVNGTNYNSFSPPVWQPPHVQTSRPPQVKMSPQQANRFEKPYEYKPKNPVKATISAKPMPPSPYAQNGAQPQWIPASGKWTPQVQRIAAAPITPSPSYHSIQPQRPMHGPTMYPSQASPPMSNPHSHIQPIVTSHTPTNYPPQPTLMRQGPSTHPASAPTMDASQGHDNSPSSRTLPSDAERYRQYGGVKVKGTPYDRSAPGQQPLVPRHKPAQPTYADSVRHMRTASGASSDYLASLEKYPYLRNAFLRRPTFYSSPYAQQGGFTAEWQDHLEKQNGQPPQYTAPLGYKPPTISGYPRTNVPETAASPYNHSLVYQSPSQASTPPQYAQYQSSNDFQQQLRRDSKPALSTGGNKWDSLLQHLKQADGSSVMQTPAAASKASNTYNGVQATPQVHQPVRSSSALNQGGGVALPKSIESPERPSYSPISDFATPNADYVASRPGSSHASGGGPVHPSITSQGHADPNAIAQSQLGASQNGPYYPSLNANATATAGNQPLPPMNTSAPSGS